MPDYSSVLRQLMAKAGCPSYRALIQQSNLSRRQLEALRSGQGARLPVEGLSRMSQVLKISLWDLFKIFDIAVLEYSDQEAEYQGTIAPTNVDQTQALKAECIRLHQQLEQQREQLQQDFQRETIHALETLLLMWPTAAHRAHQDETLPAIRILPLLKPLEQLLKRWGIEVIGEVGQQTLYDPTLHQWSANSDEGAPDSGDAILITHVGYRQGMTILHRAKARLIG
jgi:molecular chaperone GrpE (heat shock protein)